MRLVRVIVVGFFAAILSVGTLGSPRTLLAARSKVVIGQGYSAHDVMARSLAAEKAAGLLFAGRYQTQYTLSAGVGNLTGSFTATVAGAGIVDIRLVVHPGSAGCLSASGTGSLDTDVGDALFIQVAGTLCPVAGHPHVRRIALVGQVTGGTASFNGASGWALVTGLSVDSNLSGTAGSASGAWVGRLSVPG